jgi:hypothetical protein
MDAALGAVGVSPTPYTDPVLPGSPAVRIRAVHVNELLGRAQ